MKLLFQLHLSLFLLLQSLSAQDFEHPVRIDQEGYYPNAPKTAIVVGQWKNNSLPVPVSFFVIREHTTDTVFRGRLSDLKQSSNSGLQTLAVDFSTLKRKGRFNISVTGYGVSYPFSIEEKVHGYSARASLKAFYFQRASMALATAYAGKWSRAAGHPDDSVIIHPSAASPLRKAGAVISTPGGWYDAGDYNKYVVNSGISMGTMLSAYEDFKKYFDTLHTNIPALNKPVPDILNELLYNLRWMLSMQDPADGGVYNKCTNPSFDPMIMPDAAHNLRYVVQKGTAAALDLAAVAAQAARIFADYKNELPGFSDSCLRAAEKAWIWAESNQAMAYDQNVINQKFEPKIVTGGYGDRYFSDEFFWAACELSITTSSDKYRAVILKHTSDPFTLPSWSQTGLLGYYSLLRKGTATKMEKDTIQMRLLRMADDYIRASGTNAFRTVMGGRTSDFNWGSNANAANQGILLIQVYRFTKNNNYLNAALGNLEYICGRNATGYCFITGFGSLSPMHPHHRPSIADGVNDPVPGLLAGGPNPGEQDHCTYIFHEPETAYTDDDCAYASNEIAINWNAPLVYLANAIEALEKNFNVKE